MILVKVPSGVQIRRVYQFRHLAVSGVTSGRPANSSRSQRWTAFSFMAPCRR